MIIVPSKNPHKMPKVLMEITDYPYANELTKEAYEDLKRSCEEKIAKYYRAKKAAAKALMKQQQENEDEAKVA